MICLLCHKEMFDYATGHRCNSCEIIYVNETNRWLFMRFDDIERFGMPSIDDESFRRMAKLKAFW